MRQPTAYSPLSTVTLFKSLFLTILSGVILALPFANARLWIFSWFGYVPLFIVLRDKTKFDAFLFSYLTGMVFWLATVYWVVNVTVLGMFLLVLYLALYFGVFGLVVSTIDRRPSASGAFFISSVWIILEYIRGHLFTGFPWALLGYSQYLNLCVIQIADITGVWGVSFLVMMVNVAVYSVTKSPLRLRLRQGSYPFDYAGGRGVTSVIKRCVVPLLCIIVTLSYGYYKLYHRPSTIDHRPIKISVIQGNIPQELKWNRNARDFIIKKYLGLSREAMKESPDLIIWPEAALPVVLEEHPIFFKKVIDFIKEINIPLLLGAVTTREDLYYNSALLVSAEGSLLERYDKLHLVPFGEYIPLGKILWFLETIVPIGDFVAGKEYTIFKLQATSYKLPANFAVLICFEDLFPELSRAFTNRGADFLVNITNDAWFGMTSSPYQHLCASVFRAIENRVFLVRAANTGVSGFIKPSGKIMSLVRDERGRNIFIDGYHTQSVSITKKSFSFYTRFGDIFVTVCLLFVVYGIIRTLKMAAQSSKRLPVRQTGKAQNRN